jgi:hypothetical protein
VVSALSTKYIIVVGRKCYKYCIVGKGVLPQVTHGYNIKGTIPKLIDAKKSSSFSLGREVIEIDIHILGVSNTKWHPCNPFYGTGDSRGAFAMIRIAQYFLLNPVVFGRINLFMLKIW